MKKQSSIRIVRQASALVIALAVMLGSMYLFGVEGGTYAATQPAVSKRVVGIPYEQALVRYCEALSRVDGVTGVGYREYSALEKSAVVTVFFDNSRTSTRQIQTFLGNTSAIWDQGVRI